MSVRGPKSGQWCWSRKSPMLAVFALWWRGRSGDFLGLLPCERFASGLRVVSGHFFPFLCSLSAVTQQANCCERNPRRDGEDGGGGRTGWRTWRGGKERGPGLAAGGLEGAEEGAAGRDGGGRAWRGGGAGAWGSGFGEGGLRGAFKKKFRLGAAFEKKLVSLQRQSFAPVGGFSPPDPRTCCFQ